MWTSFCGFFFFAVVFAACDPSDETTCATFFTMCTASASDHASQCGCLNSFIACSNATDCLTPKTLSADIDACSTLGCQCQLGAPTPQPSRPSGCNQTLYYECSSEFVTCSVSNSVCQCYKTYLNKCVMSAGCETPSSVQRIAQTCRSLGCSSSQCALDKCDSNGASVCANKLRQCASSGRVCPCYVSYIGCMLTTKCLTAMQLATTEASCASAGCSGCYPSI
jgi:hypothetical protein